MSKIIKNTTGTDIEIEAIGRTIPTSGQVLFPPTDYLLLADPDTITEITSDVNAGNLIINDGTNDLSASEGLDYLQYPDDATNIRFTPTSLIPDDTVQEAIQNGVSNALNAPRYTIPLLYNGTVSNNEFIGYTNLIPGDSTPIIVPKTGFLEEYTFSNRNSNADYTIELRRNSTTATVFDTESKTNTQSFIKDGINEPFNAGDEIYVKYLDNGNNATDVVIILLFRAT